MQYYEVYPASQRYQKMEPLTYRSPLALQPYAVVALPFGRQEIAGVVVRSVKKPPFETKVIERTIADALLPPEALRLFDWLQSYYPAGAGPTIQLFLPSSILKLRPEEIIQKLPKKKKSALILPPLTPQQIQTLSEIQKAKQKHFLLHGETGSGKTRVYVERVRHYLEQGKSALILTPEIALTPQLKNDLAQEFGERVIIIHSNLTAKRRRQDWLRIATASEPLVIVGPRSALFSPIHNLGLIVVDEFHEPAYKQEQAPRYQAIRAAAALAKLHTAEIIYGSATPPVSEYFLAETTKTPIIRMSGSAKGNASGVKTELISLADKQNFNRNPYLSDQLLTAVTEAIHHKEQSLIYLNRRGTARLVLCQTCGWQAVCPNCDLPLTYHGDHHHIRCHTCGHTATPPLTCPTCDGADLQYRTIGTKALVEMLQSLFPMARIRRFDTDLGATERLDRHFDEVRAGDVDILVGTQMLGKGLDLPKLAVVGVIAADTSLYLPDYTAAERSYQLLHQVLGRVGRGHPLKSGEARVIIQTYVPENPVLQSAIQKDWATFYAYELIERKTFLFPPFCYLLKLSISRKSSTSAEAAAQAVHQQLSRLKIKARLSRPAPAYYEHTHGLYHWQLVLKATDRKELLKAISSLPSGGWTYDLDPADLL